MWDSDSFFVGAYPQKDLHGCLLPYGLYVPRGFLELTEPVVERSLSINRTVEMALRWQREGRIICWRCGHLWPAVVFRRSDLLRLFKRVRTQGLDLETEIRGHYRDYVAKCPSCRCRSHLATSGRPSVGHHSDRA